MTPSHPHPHLGEPPALLSDGLRVIPLGGLGDIGRNMTTFEHAGRLLIVDCGVLFPEEHQPGVDLILPTSATSVTASTTSSASCSRTGTRTTSVACPTFCANVETSR